MALDAAFLKLVANELNERILGAKVDKVYQPERDEFVFVMRTYGDTLRLRISASSANPAVYITAHSKDNPKQAPMLCMYLRKLFTGGKFIGAETPEAERVITLSFECTDEMGYKVVRKIIVEIMGRNSNVVFTDSEGKILEAAKHIGGDINSKRIIIAGMSYTLPPNQGKISPYKVTLEDIKNSISLSSEPLCDVLLHFIAGFSPIVCRELAFRASGDERTLANNAKPEAVFEKLGDMLNLLDKGGELSVVSHKISGDKIDFSFFAPNFYGNSVEIKRYDTPSELLDAFYYERDRAERIKQRTLELSRLVSRSIERIVRRNAAQRSELLDCDNADELRLRGELITANIYRIPNNSSFVVVENFYDNNNEIKIPLDNSLTPQRNAQKYFKEYRKSITRKNKLTEQLQKGEEELEWLQSVALEIEFADGEEDIARIRQELASEGYVRAQQTQKTKDVEKEFSFESTVTSDGFKVYFGRNNLQNDRLTMRFASNNDIWFHVRENFGSHVVLKTEGKEPTEIAVYEAACIAVQQSKAASGTKVSVDYTQIRNVWKPKGARPGKVLYQNFKTIII